MSEQIRDRIKKFKELGLLLQAQLFEQQIREGIPAIFAASGYEEGTYEISFLKIVPH